MSNISTQYGFDWKTLWNHPQNAPLKSLRKDPNILLPGDVVFIPDKQHKQISVPTNAKQTFKVKDVPAKLRVRLLKKNAPRIDANYVLNVDGTLFQGRTDRDGWIETPIAPNAKQAKLTLPDTNEEYPLLLGHLDPIDQPSGVQSRLRSLGYLGRDVTGQMDAATAAAVTAFQKDRNLPQTGRSDSQTQKALKAAYGS